MAKRNKFGAIKTQLDGITFHSRLEARRYAVLKDRELRGEIDDLRLQVRFPLTLNEHKLCTYLADFCYRIGDEELIEGTKSQASITPIFKLALCLVGWIWSRIPLPGFCGNVAFLTPGRWLEGSRTFGICTNCRAKPSTAVAIGNYGKPLGNGGSKVVALSVIRRRRAVTVS